MYEQFPEVMNMLWARMLRDNKKNWRRVYKVGFPTMWLFMSGPAPIGPKKKNVVWFRFPTDPVNLFATQIIL